LIFSADNLPTGLTLDPQTGQITGTAPRAGEYTVTLRAKNAGGDTRRNLLIKSGNTLALTPPMGWVSWNCFGASVSDAKIRAAADAMVKSGLINHGWTYINIDDFWQKSPTFRQRTPQGMVEDPTLTGPERSPDGTILPNLRFPDMKGLADYIHAKGLKVGLYSSPGAYTCGGCTGSYQHEDQDARQYAAWGFDSLKYDWCGYRKIYQESEGVAGMKKPYEVMAASLAKVNRDIIYSLSPGLRTYAWINGHKNIIGYIWQWAPGAGANLWRTGDDIHDSWKSVIANGEQLKDIGSFASPGHWNDPDMLVVGHISWGGKPSTLTPDEQYTEISLWSLGATPLLLSCDLSRFDPFTLGLLTNDEVIAVDQDPLGKAAHVIPSITPQTLSTPSANAGIPSVQTWVRPLHDGSLAVGLVNLGDSAATASVNWSDLQLNGSWAVRDLWRQKDLGTFTQKFEASVPAHGVVLVRIASPGALPLD